MTFESVSLKFDTPRFNFKRPQLELHEGDLARADQILLNAESCDPQSNAALLGDKRFIYSTSGRSFLSFAARGKHWLAFGGPVGLASEASELVEKFISLARAAKAKPSLYGVGPGFIPLAEALNLRLIKTGERAVLNLETFSLEGKTRQVIRTHRNRHLKNGYSVVVEGPGAVRPNLGELQAISDQWLKFQAGGEKGFGLGRFDLHYIDRLPLATVRSPEGKIEAFASLWPTADLSRLGVDLMRYGENAPNGVMDFLFAEIFLWAKAQSYKAFDLNTSPLAGVEPCPKSPFVTTIGKLFYEHGEKLYNFQGVRRFKNKFHPDWEDVYFAAAKEVIPFNALATAAILINRPKLNR